MQVVHGSSAKKKPMQVVEEGKEEKLEEFNAEEALENLENINQEPEEATDAVEEEPQEANHPRRLAGRWNWKSAPKSWPHLPKRAGWTSSNSGCGNPMAQRCG